MLAHEIIMPEVQANSRAQVLDFLGEAVSKVFGRDRDNGTEEMPSAEFAPFAVRRFFARLFGPGATDRRCLGHQSTDPVSRTSAD